MAIIKTDLGPYVLDALNEEIVIGPGGTTDLDADDTDVLVFQISATSGTWTITTAASLDGTNWSNVNVGTYGSSGNTATISAAGTTLANIYNIFHNNLPYLRIRVTSYTSGVITIAPLFTRRQQTR